MSFQLKHTVYDSQTLDSNQLCPEMTNNFLGGVYKTSKFHERSLSSDKMHAAWGIFVSVCVRVHVTEFAIFVFISACVLQDCNQYFHSYMSEGVPDTYVEQRS